MSTAAIYKVVWSNEHNSGELPDEYVGIETAIKAGREWEAEMVAIDDSHDLTATLLAAPSTTTP